MKLKVNTSLPIDIVKQAKQYIENHGMTFSGLVAVALKEYMNNHE